MIFRSGEKIFLLKKHFILLGANDVFFKIIKKINGGVIKIDNDEMNINLDILSVCENYCKQIKIVDKNYLKYLENKIIELK